MSNFVLDTSVTLAWFFKDEKDVYSLQVYESISHENIVFVPSLFFIEVINVLLVGERRGRNTFAESEKFLKVLNGLPLKIMYKPSFEKIMEFGKNYSLSSYDAFYLNLAKEYDAPLATNDKQLRAAAEAEGLSIYLI